MRLLKTTEYAIRVLCFMASKEKEKVSVSTICDSLKIPYKYLGKIMTDLYKAGFIVSSKGKNGGYLLAKPKNEINLAMIVKHFEGLDVFDRCILGLPECTSANPCAMHQQWFPVQSTIKIKFQKLSLRELSAMPVELY